MGSTTYRVERSIPFPVSVHGVRSKLGVEDHELEDRDIDLLMAYATISESYNIAPYIDSGDMNALIVTNAIEAQAALQALPSLQLAVARSEDSGTNKYQRFGSIDWEGLAASLDQMVYRLAVLSGEDVLELTGVIFTASGPATDRVTGSDYVV